MKRTILTLLVMMTALVGMAQGKVNQMTTDDFTKKVFDYRTEREWKYTGERPCVIDFYATWCGPCKMLAPRLITLAEEYAGKVDFYKVDTDKEPELASLFGIRSIPTLIFVPTSGAIPQASQGLLDLSVLRQMIDVNLLNKKPVAIEFIQPGE